MDPRQVGIPGWYHLALFGVLIPWVALRSRRRVGARPLPLLRRHLPRVFLQLVILGAVSVWIGRLEWVPLFPKAVPPLWTIALGLFSASGAAAAMRPLWRRAVSERKRLTYLFMPRDGTERALWVLTSVAAGVSEEITWRGVQWVLLTRVLGNAWIAAALCIATFAVAHALQGGRTVLLIVGFAAAFHGLVALAGSLYVAMASHALYDVLAGLHYGRFGEQLGYPRDPAELGPAPPG